MAGVHTLGLAAVPGDGPNRLLSSCRITGGIRHLADCVLAFTAHIDNRVGVRGKTEVQELLAVILAVFCELPCRECGPFGHPDVAPAFLIQNPSDAVGILCRNQAGGKRRAHYLFERERFLRVRARRQNQQSHCTAQGVTLHRSLSSRSEKYFHSRIEKFSPQAGVHPLSPRKLLDHRGALKSSGRVQCQNRWVCGPCFFAR